MRNTKREMRETRVVARGVVPLANGEAAQGGAAVAACNVREREQSLQVTGMPRSVGTIAAGDRLLLMDGDYVVTCRGRVVSIDGIEVVTLTGDVVGAHDIGGIIVVVASDGMTYLSRRDGVWRVLDPDGAVPQLTFGASVATSHASIDAYSFVEPYDTWRAPLADADATALEQMLRSAWNALVADARAEGRHTSPMLVRWAVRLKDGSHLWMSDAVRVGDVTLTNADRITAIVETRNSGFVGTQATTMPLSHYSLTVDVTRAIAADWLPLVAAIDVFATDEAQLLTASRALDYRCLTRTTGGREYLLEMGLSRRSATAIDTQLASSPWHLVATAAASASLTGSDFGLPVEAVTLTNAQCAAIGTMRSIDGVVCSTSAGGRLYCCTSGGDVVVSQPGNALVEAHRRSVLGAVPLSMAVVTRPLYSGGFGRYPVYVFTDDGIYAIPQSATGTLGEARLVDRTVIAAGLPPVEAGRDIWLMSRHGHLCRLSGAALSVALNDVDCRALAWCNAHRELWLLPSAGMPVAMMESGRLSERTVAASQLYSDPRHAVAVTADGALLDLEQEIAATMPVNWQSHPVALHPLLGEAVKRVVWHVVGDGLSLTLRVTGQRGIMAQDSDVSLMNVNGAVDQPLASPTMAVRCRTVRLSLDGEARSGTLVLPTLLYTIR